MSARILHIATRRAAIGALDRLQFLHKQAAIDAMDLALAIANDLPTATKRRKLNATLARCDKSRAHVQQLLDRCGP